MLTVDTIGRIRRENFRQGKTIKEIARKLRVSRNTVRKVLRSGETSFEYDRKVQPRPKLGRWMSDLEELLAANGQDPWRGGSPGAKVRIAPENAVSGTSGRATPR